ncbi:hypothetical protein [Brucella intermedia]|uniref:hypothetical protein n=1 Tax=Brucella intermedia TaxID=94625 RepID=UPI00235EF123|nr:hypothetical protein [Brucella intermedia]
MNGPLDEFGLKLSVVIAGFAGGALRALSRKRYTVRGTIASPICGALAAGYLTGPLMHYLNAVHFPLPPDDGSNAGLHAAAFVVGACGMWISDALFEIVTKRFKQ